MTDAAQGALAPASPGISVVIPVHNRQGLLAACLDSVARQTIPVPIEVIVVDDNSDDHSAQVARDRGAIVIRHSTNLGPGQARNTGLRAARAKWIAFLDSDDLWHPDHLRTLWVRRDGVALLATSGITWNGAHPRVHGSPFLHDVELRRPDDILRPENIVNTSAVLVSAESLRAVGGFSPSRFSEDLELWLRILDHERGRVLSRLTVVNRDHANRVTRTNSQQMGEGTADVLQVAASDDRLSPKARAGLEAVAAWDNWRSSGSHRVADLRTTTSGLGDSVRLLQLWWNRAKLRNRWRLQRPRVAELYALAQSS